MIPPRANAGGFVLVAMPWALAALAVVAACIDGPRWIARLDLFPEPVPNYREEF